MYCEWDLYRPRVSGNRGLFFHADETRDSSKVVNEQDGKMRLCGTRDYMLQGSLWHRIGLEILPSIACNQ